MKRFCSVLKLLGRDLTRISVSPQIFISIVDLKLRFELYFVRVKITFQEQPIKRKHGTDHLKTNLNEASLCGKTY